MPRGKYWPRTTAKNQCGKQDPYDGPNRETITNTVIPTTKEPIRIHDGNQYNPETWISLFTAAVWVWDVLEVFCFNFSTRNKITTKVITPPTSCYHNWI